MNLRGATILITGGRRVGQAVARELAKAGANIAMTYRYRSGRDEIMALTDSLRTEYAVKTNAYDADLAYDGSVRGLFFGVQNDFGRVDGLINMASLYQADPPHVTVAAMHHLFAVAFGNMLLSRLFAEATLARKRAENLTEPLNAPIITFSDWAVEHPYSGYGLYLSAKAAEKEYMKTLQLEEDFVGVVRVVNILPGMIQPPPDLSETERQQIIANTPTQNCGTPEQAAKLTHTALELDFAAGDWTLDGGQSWRHRL